MFVAMPLIVASALISCLRVKSKQKAGRSMHKGSTHHTTLRSGGMIVSKLDLYSRVGATSRVDYAYRSLSYKVVSTRVSRIPIKEICEEAEE